MSRIIESCMNCFSHHMARETGNLSCLKTNTRITDANIIPADCPLPSIDDKMRKAWNAGQKALLDSLGSYDVHYDKLSFDEWRQGQK